MSSPNLKQSVLALSILQAFAASAYAQSAEPTISSVVVTANKLVAADYASVGGFSDTPLLQTPAAISAFGRQRMQELGIRNTTDAMKFDASVNDAYNAVGYAEQFSIRGFELDNASSYRKDGFAIPGDTQIPLENKERLEILKGLAGLQAGMGAPGGIVNYVTKRPTNTPLRSVTVEARERGTLYGAVDLGGRFEDRRFGYRINAAAERLRSYVKGADGERQFASGAFDWQLTPDALVQLDVDYQHKAQISAAGYQLIRNAELPAGVSARTLLNSQPWSKPVDTRSSNVGLRFEYTLAADWRASVALNKHWFMRDDYAAFPYGCSNEGGFHLGFCSNGDYDLYDYQSAGEKKSPFGAQALLQGKFATGAVRHALTLGAEQTKRRDQSGDWVYDYVGSSNIYHNVVNPPAPPDHTTGPVFERSSENERAVFAQDIATLSPQFTLHTGLRYVQVKRSEYVPEIESYVQSENSFVLPSVALVYSPNQDWSVYGALTHGMEHGGLAPIEATNNAHRSLGANRSKQLEFGVKGMVSDAMTVTAALFQIRRGLEYTNADYTYVRNGEQTHRGLELSAQGRASASLAYSLSLMALNTRQDGTGQADMDGKRAPDVPAFKSSAWLEYALPSVAGLKLNGAWQYAGKKAFDKENTVFVPGYHVFDFGASYATRVGGAATTLRAGLNNAFDKFYWRDVTPALGGYLLPGAPRTVKLSAQFDF